MITVVVIVLGLLAAIAFAAWPSSRPKKLTPVSTGARASDTVPIWMMAGMADSKTCADPAADTTSPECGGGGTVETSGGSDGGGGGCD